MSNAAAVRGLQRAVECTARQSSAAAVGNQLELRGALLDDAARCFVQPVEAGVESRVAAGELSLRGVNATTLEIPDALLVDADTPAALADLERLA